MPRLVKGGLIQCSNPINDEDRTVKEIQDAALEKHIPFIEDAGQEGVQILCLQEIFNGPYFCPSQDGRWYDAAEPIPGPTTEALTPYAQKYEMVLIIPLYERGWLKSLAQAGVYYNSAAIIDADGKYLGTYRKNHLPHTSGASGRNTSSSPAISAIPSSTPPMQKSVFIFGEARGLRG